MTTAWRRRCGATSILPSCLPRAYRALRRQRGRTGPVPDASQPRAATGASHGIRAPRMRVHPNGLLNFASDEAAEGEDPHSGSASAAKPRRRRWLPPIQAVSESPHREPMRDAFAKELQSEARAQLRREATRRRLARSVAALGTSPPPSPEATAGGSSLHASQSTPSRMFRVAGRPGAAPQGRSDPPPPAPARRGRAPDSEPLTYIPHTRVIPAVAARPHWRAPARGRRHPTPEPASPPATAARPRRSPVRGTGASEPPKYRLQPLRARPGGDRAGASPSLPPSPLRQAAGFGVRMERITIDGATAAAGRAALGTSYGTRRTRDMLVSVVSHGPAPVVGAAYGRNLQRGLSHPT